MLLHIPGFTFLPFIRKRQDAVGSVPAERAGLRRIRQCRYRCRLCRRRPSGEDAGAGRENRFGGRTAQALPYRRDRFSGCAGW